MSGDAAGRLFKEIDRGIAGYGRDALANKGDPAGTYVQYVQGELLQDLCKWLHGLAGLSGCYFFGGEAWHTNAHDTLHT